MNEKELLVEMQRHNETREQLSNFLGITRQTVARKMSDENNSDFTMGEIKKIKEHYDLSIERLEEIFFNTEVS